MRAPEVSNHLPLEGELPLRGWRRVGEKAGAGGQGCPVLRLWLCPLLGLTIQVGWHSRTRMGTVAVF